MKNLLLLTFVIISVSIANAQCIADAGQDTVFCNVGNYIWDSTFSLGGNPTVQGGTPPYTYTWKSEYWVGSTLRTASYILNDTTIPNPQLLHPLLGGDNAAFRTIYLTISDSEGNTCSDSVKIGFSNFAYSLGYVSVYIGQGDSLQIAGTVSGGFSPYTYSWSPAEYVSDSTAFITWAKPDSTTFYRCMVTDSAGCQSSWNDVVLMYVGVAGIDDIKRADIKISPNPANNYIFVEVENGSNIDELLLINEIGQVVKRKNTARTTKKYQIEVADVPNGVYGLLFRKDAKNIAQSKIIINH